MHFQRLLRAPLNLAFLSASLALSPLVAQVVAQAEGLAFEGVISSDEPFQRFAFVVEEAGSTLILDLQPRAGEAGGNLDTLLYLMDENDAIVAQNDDRRPGDTSSRIEFPQAPEGEYRVIATRYGVQDGDSEGEFELKVTIIPPSELEVRNDDYDISPEALLAAGYPQWTPRPLADWTLLIYYGADTNLEAGIINDFVEFEAAGGSNAQVRIVALMDRSPEYSTASGDWRTARLFEISGNREAVPSQLTITSRELAEFERIDSGDGLTLAQFLAWGVRAYPARRYAVAFGSHGAGWRGVITDYSEAEREGDSESILTLPELRSAFALAAQAAGIDKFDLIVNDACLMSSVEYHTVLADHFRYSLASPEIVINPALDMTLLANALRGDTSFDLARLGRQLVDQYIDVDTRRRPSSDIIYLTSALTDLSKYQALEESVQRFAEFVSENIGALATTLGQARRNTYTYSAYLGADELVDLGSFMGQIILNSSDPDLTLAAQEVLAALRNVLVYGSAGDFSRPRIQSYQNIYFPSRSEVFTTRYFEEAPLGTWGRMLRSFYNAVTPSVWSQDPNAVAFHAPGAPDIRIYRTFPTGEVTPFTAFLIRTEIIGRNIAFGDFIVDQLQADGSSIRRNVQRILRDVFEDGRLDRQNTWTSGVDLTDIFWNITLPQVAIGDRANFELFKVSEDVAALEGRYREPRSDKWNEVTLVFSAGVTGGVFQRAINRSTDSGALGDIVIPPGSTFQTYNSTVTPDGRTTRTEGNTYTWPETPPAWQWSAAPSGAYNIGFLITTFGGTTSFASVPVTVNTADADPSVRSDIRGNLLLSLSRPKDWPLLTYIGAPLDAFRTISPDGRTQYTIWFFFRTDSDDPNRIIDLVTTKYAQSARLSIGEERTPIDLGLRQGLEFDVSYLDGLREFRGRGFAFWHQTNFAPVGYVITAASTGDDVPTEYETLKRYLVLHDVTAQSDGTLPPLWTQLRNVPGLSGLQFPMLLSWTGQADEQGFWTRYTAAEDSSAFLAIAPIATDNPLFLEDDPNGTLSALMNEYVAAGGVSDLRTESRRYTGENNTWNVLIYEGQRDDVAIYGRMYLTSKSGRTYAVWTEATREDAPQVYKSALEPIVDGLLIP